MRSTSDVTGVVLAGGKGSRLGRDKALVRLGRESLLERAVRRLRLTASSVVIVVSAPGELRGLGFLEGQGVEIAVDALSCGGPLAGIHAGLKAARTDRCVVVGCDMPFVDAGLLAYMAEGLEDADVVVPLIEGRGFVEPLCAAYSRACVLAIERVTSCGPARVVRLFDEVRVRYVGEDVWRRFDPEGLSFVNINTPSDLARVRMILRRQPDGRGACGDIDMPHREVRKRRADGDRGRGAGGGEGHRAAQRGGGRRAPLYP